MFGLFFILMCKLCIKAWRKDRKMTLRDAEVCVHPS